MRCLRREGGRKKRAKRRKPSPMAEMKPKQRLGRAELAKIPDSGQGNHIPNAVRNHQQVPQKGAPHHSLSRTSEKAHHSSLLSAPTGLCSQEPLPHIGVKSHAPHPAAVTAQDGLPCIRRPVTGRLRQTPSESPSLQRWPRFQLLSGKARPYTTSHPGVRPGTTKGG